MSNRKQLSLSILMLVGILLGFSTARAQQFLSDDPQSRLSTIPHNPALAEAVEQTGLESIAVRHEGWNETLYTWSRLKLYELTGRTHVHGQNPAYTVLSMMYEPQKWVEAKIIPIEHPRIAQALELPRKWASPREVIENKGLSALQTELQAVALEKELHDEQVALLNTVHQIRTIGPDRPQIYESIVPPDMSISAVRELVGNAEARNAAHQKLEQMADAVDNNEAFLKAGGKLLHRAQLAFQLKDQFLVIPDSNSASGEWIPIPHGEHNHDTENEIQPAANVVQGRLDLPTAAGELDHALSHAFIDASAQTLGAAVNDFKRVVDLSRYYPDSNYLSRKNFYIQFNPAKWAAYTYAIGVILFGLFLFFRGTGWRIAGTIALGGGILLHTFDLLLRISLTGRMPVANMYESIVFTAWAAMVIGAGAEIWKRNGLAGLFSAVIGVFALLGVSLMPLHESRIHPLRAVLDSYWLNIHVTMMLISYGAFAVSAFFAAGYLLKSLLKRETLIGKSALMPMDQMEEFAYRLVQVGWPILTVGICLGAIWADTAWGRFWGWDPKETWAFITWIAYTIYLHTRMVIGWKGRISALVCLLGFLMVLITWIGVSYIPWFAGGLHTYASPT